MENTVASTPAAGAENYFDIVRMFTQADIVVQTVLVALLITSVISWAIAISRASAIARERRATSRFEKLYWSGRSLEDIERNISTRPQKTIGAMFLAALKEWRLSIDGGAKLNAPNFRERLNATMEVEASRSISRLEKGLLFLATVGAAGPFVGLFGTVWGIMRAFTSIAEAQNASIAVVAPGIAEALSTTAIGLAAAIPAVIFYNKLSNDLAALGSRLETFSREFWTTVSRELDLDRARAGDPAGAPQ